MAKDRACARKTDGSPLCPGPASPRDPRDPFAFCVLPFSVRALCPVTASAILNTQSMPQWAFITRSETSAHIFIRCFHGCFSIAQLLQNVYLPGGICQKVYNFNHYFTYFSESFCPPLVPQMEIWYTFPTKYALGRRDSHGEVSTGPAASFLCWPT